MKTSNKILWGSLGGLFGTTVILLIAARIMLSGDPEETGVPISDVDQGSRVVAMVDFTGVELRGNWRAELKRGPEEHILVEGPEDLLSTLWVRRKNHSLVLQMAEQRQDNRKLNVTITMPDLQDLKAKGVVDATFTGFDTQRLSILTKGVTSVLGKKGRIGALYLKGKGVSKINLRQVPAVSAQLDCTGVINIDLSMDGGELTGSLKGVGELRYSGETSRASIRQEGPCKVTSETRI